MSPIANGKKPLPIMNGSSVKKRCGRTIATNEEEAKDVQALNPKKYFIIIPALFGNGQSTSPSNVSEFQT